MKKFIWCSLACLLFIGCANEASGDYSTIHNESNINPSVSNNTIGFGTDLPFGRNESSGVDSNLNLAIYAGEGGGNK